MKTIIKKVHYCDFCRKKTFTLPSMTKHELHCTGNIDRECGLCALAGEAQPSKETVLKAAKMIRLVDWDCSDSLKENTRKELGKMISPSLITPCPACKLTVIRAAGGFNNVWNDFDFQTERKQFLAYQND